MATAAYSSRRSLSGESIVGAPPDGTGQSNPVRPGLNQHHSHHHHHHQDPSQSQSQPDEDEDELIELEGEDDEMSDRKSVDDGLGGSPRKVLSFEDDLAQSLSTTAPKTQVQTHSPNQYSISNTI